MKNINIALIFASILLVGLVLGCSSLAQQSENQEEDATVVVPILGALSGTWRSAAFFNGMSIAPVEDPDQLYEYDIELNLTQQGNQIMGMMTQTLRRLPSDMPELEPLLDKGYSYPFVGTYDDYGKISFKVGNQQWSGKVENNMMTGNVNQSQSNMDWSGTFALVKV